MFRKLRDLLCEWCGVAFIGALIVSPLGIGWYMIQPTTYTFENGARLVVPCGAISIDQRDKGDGIVVESGVNVTVHNDGDEWRTLVVCYRKPNYGILDNHAIEDLPPKSSKTFGAEPGRYEGMHVSISDYAQKKRDLAAK